MLVNSQLSYPPPINDFGAKHRIILETTVSIEGVIRLIVGRSSHVDILVETKPRYVATHATLKLMELTMQDILNWRNNYDHGDYDGTVMTCYEGKWRSMEELQGHVGELMQPVARAIGEANERFSNWSG